MGLKSKHRSSSILYQYGPIVLNNPSANEVSARGEGLDLQVCGISFHHSGRV
jgi:uncharacterized phosphosugar-binding protein